MMQILFLLSLIVLFQPKTNMISGDFNGDGVSEKAYLKNIREKNGEEITTLSFNNPLLGSWNTEKQCIPENAGNIDGIRGDEILLSHLQYERESDPAHFQILAFDPELNVLKVIASGKEPLQKKQGTAKEKIIEKKGSQIFICSSVNERKDTLILLAAKP
jgi:hypothetical protein